MCSGSLWEKTVVRPRKVIRATTYALGIDAEVIETSECLQVVVEF